MDALKRFHVKLPLRNHNITIILYMLVKRCHFLTCLKRILWSQACINIVLNISLACTNHYQISLQWGPSRSNTKPMAKPAQSRMENNTLTYDCDNGNAVALPHILGMSEEEEGGEYIKWLCTHSKHS